LPWQTATDRWLLLSRRICSTLPSRNTCNRGLSPGRIARLIFNTENSDRLSSVAPSLSINSRDVIIIRNVIIISHHISQQVISEISHRKLCRWLHNIIAIIGINSIICVCKNLNIRITDLYEVNTFINISHHLHYYIYPHYFHPWERRMFI